MKFTLLAFVFLSQLSWAASDMVCGIDADCGRLMEAPLGFVHFWSAARSLPRSVSILLKEKTQ
jgi:hypothetical protein